MFLRSRLNQQTPGMAPGSKPAYEPGRSSGLHWELKVKAHRTLIEALRGQGLDDASPDEIHEVIRTSLEQVLQEAGTVLGRSDKEALVTEIYHDSCGYGPLDPLLNDDEISEIMVNNPRQVYVERRGKIELSSCSFYDDRHLLRIIDRIVSQVGRRIDESSPMCDARLPDGSRINAIIPPLAIDGPALTIRKFQREALRIQHLVAYGSLNRAMADFLEGCVRARLNVLISGGTGSGKTTLLNVLSGFIPEDERLITIEDAAELQLQQPHVIRLETRPSNSEGTGGVSQAELLKNCLRMRPDRIILGEVRGPEALALLQAMNTGHEGALATLHANGTRDALSRLETMVLMTGVELPLRAVREQIASALDLIIQIERSADGTRRLTSITEIAGMEGESILLQDLYTFQREGLDPAGRLVGQHRPTGLVPRCANKLALKGIVLPSDLF